MGEDKKKSILTGRRMFEILEAAGVVFPNGCKGFELNADYNDAATIKFKCYIELDEDIVSKQKPIDLGLEGVLNSDGTITKHEDR